MLERIGAALLGSLVLSAACGAGSDSDVCGEDGEHVVVDGVEYCVYREEVVIEGGFDCPAALSERIDVPGGVVCAASAGDVPDVVCTMTLGNPCEEPVRMPDGGLLRDAGALDGGFDAGPPDAGPPPVDRIVYISAESGTAEVWVRRVDGSDPVRVTEGMSDTTDTSAALWYPRVAPTGRRVGIVSRRNDDGSFGDSRRIWYFGADGSAPTVASGADGFYGFDFEPDGNAVLWSRDVTCSNDLRRTDLVTGADTLIYDTVEIANMPTVSDTSASEILFHHNRCAVGGDSALLTVGGAHVDLEPTTSPPRGNPGGFSSDGGRVVYTVGSWDTPPHSVYIYDRGSSTETLVLTAPSGDRMYRCRFGPADAYLVCAHSTSELAPRVTARVDIATGAMTSLGFATTGDFDLGALPADIDRDGDGLANGIDPMPDG